jgi:hypothetical protein
MNAFIQCKEKYILESSIAAGMIKSTSCFLL